jgi:hypothetical protein
MKQWFRLYHSLLDNPKIQRLTPALFKHWINLLCLAARHDGSLPNLDDIAFGLRLSKIDAASVVQELGAAGLVDDQPDKSTMHDWDVWQFRDDGAAERMREYRNRTRYDKNAVTGHTVTRYDFVTPPDQSRTDQNQTRPESEESVVAPLAASPTTNGSGKEVATEKTVRGSRLAIEIMPDDWRAECNLDRPDLDPNWAWRCFIDYWLAKPGAAGRKLDWHRTWRNWYRAQRVPPNQAPKVPTREEIEKWGR